MTIQYKDILGIILTLECDSITSLAIHIDSANLWLPTEAIRELKHSLIAISEADTIHNDRHIMLIRTLIYSLYEYEGETSIKIYTESDNAFMYNRLLTKLGVE